MLDEECIYCGCTDTTPCMTPREKLSGDVLRGMLRYHKVDSVEQLPERVPCGWFFLEPPVCTAPHCEGKHRAATGAEVSRV